MEENNKIEKLYNCEKYLKLRLLKNGMCELNGKIEEFGYPVAGEINAFAIEFVIPAKFKDFDKFVLITYEGNTGSYDLKNASSKITISDEEYDLFYLILPNIADKGGLITLSVYATKNYEIIKWKPYCIKVLDAPLASDGKIPEKIDSITSLNGKMKTVLDFMEEIQTSEVSINESFDGQSKGRSIKVDGVDSLISENSQLEIALSPVTENNSGDMTPEMLQMLKAATPKENFPNKSVISGLVLDTQTENLIKLNYKLTPIDRKGGEEQIVEGFVFPFASEGNGGFMSAEDKKMLANIVPLDESNLIPENYLPKNIIESNSYSNFPLPGEFGKIYIACDTNQVYRWTEGGYTEISSRIALGETSETAYRGDRGKIAYDHSQTQGNPHNTTKENLNLGNVVNERQYSAQNMQPYPMGFASADNSFGWGVNIGSPLRVWNEASGGSIGFRKNCPENGKLSIVVDGKVYVDEGQKELATLDSPTFTGAPKVPTPSQSSNDNTVANTAWVKNILNEGSIALYRHRILLSGTNTSVSNAFTLGLIEVYTKSSQPITTVAGVAAALGITGNMELVPVSGCAENGSNHTVLCTEAWVSPSSITLHGMYFGYSSGNGIIERVSTTVTSVSDKVSLVQ